MRNSEWNHWGRIVIFDSAEKPPLVKKRHFKTPPKGGARFENAAHIEFWSENFSSIFPCAARFSKTGGFLAESIITIRPRGLFDEDGNIMLLAIEKPGRLFNGQTSWQFPKQG